MINVKHIIKLIVKKEKENKTKFEYISTKSTIKFVIS